MCDISISYNNFTKLLTYYPQMKIDYFEYFKTYIHFNKTFNIIVTVNSIEQLEATYTILYNFKHSIRTKVNYSDIFIFVESCQFLLAYSTIYLLDMDTFYRKPIFDEIYFTYSEIDKLLYSMYILDNLEKTRSKVVSPNGLERRNKLIDPNLTAPICFAQIFDNLIQYNKLNLTYWLFKTFEKWIPCLPINSLNKLDIELLKKFQSIFTSNNITTCLLIKYSENNCYLELIYLLNNTFGYILHNTIIDYILKLSNIDLNILFEKIGKCNFDSYLSTTTLTYPSEITRITGKNIENSDKKRLFREISSNPDILYLKHNKVHVLNSDIDYIFNQIVITKDKSIYCIENNKIMNNYVLEYELNGVRILINHSCNYTICYIKNKLISYLHDYSSSCILNIIVCNSLSI